MEPRRPYPSDISNEKCAVVAPYLALIAEDAPQRVHPLREVFDGLRWAVRAGATWRMRPHDLPLGTPSIRASPALIQSRLRRAQEEERLENAPGGGYPRTPACLAYDACERAREPR